MIGATVSHQFITKEEVAEMSKEEFIKYLGQNGVSIIGFDSEEEFMEEYANAKSNSELHVIDCHAQLQDGTTHGFVLYYTPH